MKSIVELYSLEEFKLISEINSVHLLLDREGLDLTCLPYHVVKNKSLINVVNYSSTEHTELAVLTQKLDFAIKVWLKTIQLTRQKYPAYLEHEWIYSPISYKKLKLTCTIRKEAETYFNQTLKDVCNHEELFSIERVQIGEPFVDYTNTTIKPIQVIVNEDSINEELVDSLREKLELNQELEQHTNNKKRFTYEDIKDFFVNCDERFLTLLHSEDGLLTQTEAEKALFKSAKEYSKEGVIQALKSGAMINALDAEGETAFTKLFERFNNPLTAPFEEEYQNELKKAIEFAQFLLDLGADCNVFGYNGLNALMYAAYLAEPLVMQFLLENGANPNINYYPGEEDVVKSMPLDRVLFNFNMYDDETEHLKRCEALLKQHGAERYHEKML